MVPVIYQDVLDTIPLFHARPPTIPLTPHRQPDTVDPPTHGYDLVIHVGAGSEGAVRTERYAHKTGYRLPDTKGRYPPSLLAGQGIAGTAASAEERRETERLKCENVGTVYGLGGEEFGDFEEVLETVVDIDQLVEDLQRKSLNVEVSLNCNRLYEEIDLIHITDIRGRRSLCLRLHLLRFFG